MLLTEEEAKTKWCPFARVGVSENVSSHSANRTPLSGIEGLNGANLCIASTCMAWRKVTVNTAHPRYPEWKDKGYCGLAGGAL